ncbi:unnamed protein product [Malus baccata var. baccata]|uniref:Uncharacterized protein n=1 Tax=Malus domestica TaxID=3750 RepID=A0A498K9F1_MALDO|nr:hypothetical protein DVH24_038342 [Malus domestica]
MNTPAKYRSIIDEKEHDHSGFEIPIPCPNRNEADPQETNKESKQRSDFVDSSCRVMMLQTFVQVLCAEVLKEAAARNGIRKI